MTNKLVVIINSLKVPKIKKILLHEMKFLVPNYSCLQNPWVGGYRPQIPVLSVLNWICWTPPRTKFLGTPLARVVLCCVLSEWIWTAGRVTWLRKWSGPFWSGFLQCEEMLYYPDVNFRWGGGLLWVPATCGNYYIWKLLACVHDGDVFGYTGITYFDILLTVHFNIFILILTNLMH